MNCWQTFGIDRTTTPAQIDYAFYTKTKNCCPDNGEDRAEYRRYQRAKRIALAAARYAGIENDPEPDYAAEEQRRKEECHLEDEPKAPEAAIAASSATNINTRQDFSNLKAGLITIGLFLAFCVALPAVVTRIHGPLPEVKAVHTQSANDPLGIRIPPKLYGDESKGLNLYATVSTDIAKEQPAKTPAEVTPFLMAKPVDETTLPSVLMAPSGFVLDPAYPYQQCQVAFDKTGQTAVFRDDSWEVYNINQMINARFRDNILPAILRIIPYDGLSTLYNSSLENAGIHFGIVNIHSIVKREVGKELHDMFSNTVNGLHIRHIDLNNDDLMSIIFKSVQPNELLEIVNSLAYSSSFSINLTSIEENPILLQIRAQILAEISAEMFLRNYVLTCRQSYINSLNQSSAAN